MGRHSRIVCPGVPHHVTQRGNFQQKVFFTDEDHLMYIAILRGKAKQYGLDLLGWCLMPNHVHLIVIPAVATSLALALGRAHNDYSRWFNLQRDKTGHLWQNRFFSCPMSDAHLWAALRYVELNPVRANLAGRPEAWRWSSARAHLDRPDETGFLKWSPWREEFTPAEWRMVLGSPDNLESDDVLRKKTHSGRPCGGERFVEDLTHRLERTVAAQRPGPKKGAVREEYRQASMSFG
jgi:putative transposase